MSNTILVNNVEIEKYVIYEYLIQFKKIEAVTYLMQQTGIGIGAAKEIVEMIQDKSIDKFENKDVFKEITKNSEQFQANSKWSVNQQKPRRSYPKKGLLFLGIFILGIFLFLKYNIGFKRVETHWRDLQSVLFGNQNKLNETEGAENAIIDIVLPAIQVPIDTIKISENNSYLSEYELSEIETYKKVDFSKLHIAKDYPTDKEAESAIVYRYKNEVISLLQEHKAHIRVGTCYEATLQTTQDGDPEIARVTAMVSAFNKAQGNIGNIQLPLFVVYDFVKYQSDPYTWYITDFSQTIPYDYKLNKDL